MRVKLKYGWFASSDQMSVSGRPASGIYYRKGEHKLPDRLLEFLPSSAEVLNEQTRKYVPVKETLKDYDLDRAAAEAEPKMDPMAKAREALAAKRRKDALEKGAE